MIIIKSRYKAENCYTSTRFKLISTGERMRVGKGIFTTVRVGKGIFTTIRIGKGIFTTIRVGKGIFTTIRVVKGYLRQYAFVTACLP